MLLLLITLVGFCYSCAFNSCLKCENKISDYKSFLNQESFNNVKCFNKNDYSTVLCKTNECLTQIHIMYSSEYETKTLQDLKSHMVLIKRGCKNENVKSQCNWKQIEKRLLTYCDYICYDKDCNSEGIFDGRQMNNIRRFVPTCLKCSTLFNKEYSVISNSCNNNKMHDTQELCFGKCYITASFNKHSIHLNKGCLNDLNGFTFKSDYGIMNINGVVVYSLCNARMYEHCNSKIKTLDLKLLTSNLISMDHFLKNVKNSELNHLCLSCKSSRTYKQSETNCEKGLQSSVFNVVECSENCYTRVMSNTYKITVIRGCGKVHGSDRGEQKYLARKKYHCNDCFSMCLPRKNLICNSKQYVISNESLHNKYYERNKTQDINLIKIKNTIPLIKFNASNYIANFVNTNNNRKLYKSIHKIKTYNGKSRNKDNVKFMARPDDVLVYMSSVYPQMERTVTNLSRAISINDRAGFFRFNFKFPKNKKENILKQLESHKKKYNNDYIKAAVDIIPEIDEEEFIRVFDNNETYDYRAEAKAFVDFELSRKELMEARTNFINAYSKHYISLEFTKKLLTANDQTNIAQTRELIIAEEENVLLYEEYVKTMEDLINDEKSNMKENVLEIYTKIGGKIEILKKQLLNHILSFKESMYDGHTLSKKKSQINRLIREQLAYFNLSTSISRTTIAPHRGLDTSNYQVAVQDVVDSVSGVPLERTNREPSAVENAVKEMDELLKDIHQRLNAPNAIRYKHIYEPKVKILIKKMNAQTDINNQNDLEKQQRARYYVALKIIQNYLETLEKFDSDIIDDLIKMDPYLNIKSKEFDEDLSLQIAKIDKEIKEYKYSLDKSKTELKKMKSNETVKKDIIKLTVGTIKHRIVQLSNLKDDEFIKTLKRKYDLYDKAMLKNKQEHLLLYNESMEKLKNIVETREVYKQKLRTMPANDDSAAEEKTIVDTLKLLEGDMYDIYDKQYKYELYKEIRNSVIESNKDLLMEVENDMAVAPIIKLRKTSSDDSIGVVHKESVQRNNFDDFYKNKKINQARVMSDRAIGSSQSNSMSSISRTNRKTSVPRISNVRTNLKKKCAIGTALIGLTLGTSGLVLGLEKYYRNTAKNEAEENNILFESNDLYHDKMIKIDYDEQMFNDKISESNKEKDIYRYSKPELKLGSQMISKRNGNDTYGVMWLLSILSIGLLGFLVYLRKDSDSYDDSDITSERK